MATGRKEEIEEERRLLFVAIRGRAITSTSSSRIGSIQDRVAGMAIDTSMRRGRGVFRMSC